MFVSSSVRPYAARLGLLLSGAALALTVPMASYAQTTPTPAPIDYAGFATSASTESRTAIAAAAPIAFVLLAVLLGVGIAWRYMKKAAKSS